MTAAVTTHPYDAMPRRAEIDGVPVLWANAPGPLQGGLVFRTGMMDEAFTERGLTHLVEHLALAALGQPAHDYNGAVEFNRTSFVTSGSPEEVADFFTRVCQSLSRLPTERLETETRILQTEAQGRSGLSPLAFALGWRYGRRGPGIAYEPEHALMTVTPEKVRHWARTRFTARNAVLWLTGEPPRGLSLALPPGPRHPLPEPAPLPQKYPSWVTHEATGVLMSAVMDRSPISYFYSSVLADKAMRRLRHEQGVTYSVQNTVVPLTDKLVHLLLFADALPDQARAVAVGLLETVDELALHGSAPEDMARFVQRAHESIERDHTVADWLDTEATDLLLGRPVNSRAEVAAEIAAVTPTQVRAAAIKATTSMLWMVPSDVQITTERIVRLNHWSRARVAGNEHAPTVHRDEEPNRRLVVGPEGIMLVLDPARVVTIRYQDAVGMMAWDDGSRMLFGDDGSQLMVRPRHWKGVAASTFLIDEAVPADRVIWMGPAGDEDEPAPSEPSGAIDKLKRLGRRR